jgi:hypothetical protein
MQTISSVNFVKLLPNGGSMWAKQKSLDNFFYIKLKQNPLRSFTDETCGRMDMHESPGLPSFYVLYIKPAQDK